MTDLCYYEILKIEKNADKSTIKKAYRKMAMKYHPDKNPNDKKAEENFKAINEAYQVLSDDKKRAIYDRYGKQGIENMGQGYNDFSNGFSSNFDDLGSIFEEMFNSGFASHSQRERKTYNYNLDTEILINLEFNEAVFGCKKTIDFKYKTACKSCKGNGAKDGKLSICKTCNGQGQIHTRQGFMTFAQTCPHCRGTGQGVNIKCSKCKGTGYDKISEKIEIEIPEGINDGNRIRISSKGNIAPNGTRGDLYIQVRVKKDKHFIREDDDIYIEIPIFFTQIALGTTIKIPGLKGELELKIPAGTQDKKHFVFKNAGVKNVNGYGYGDFIVQIKIEYPKTLTQEQKELLEKLQDSFGIQSSPYQDIFLRMFDKVKKWFA